MEVSGQLVYMTEALWRQFSEQITPDLATFYPESLDNLDLTYINKVVHNSLNRFDIRISNEGHLYLVFNCAVTILRITRGHELNSSVKMKNPKRSSTKPAMKFPKG